MFREITAAACVVGLFACDVAQNDVRPDPSMSLDENVFKCSVEPILAKQCSYNACHGISLGSAYPTTPGTAALRVYTPGKLRATTPTSLDQAIMPLSSDEEHANFLSAAAFASGPTAPDDNFLLRKPLPADWGGYEHKGGAVFPTPMDGQYQKIRAWLGGTGTCN